MTERDAEWLKVAAEDQQAQVEEHMRQEWAHRWEETGTSPHPEDDNARICEIGDSGWLMADGDGYETKLLWGEGTTGFYYALTVSPQDDEKDRMEWKGPYSDLVEAKEAAWEAYRPTELAELPRPGPSRLGQPPSPAP